MRRPDTHHIHTHTPTRRQTEGQANKQTGWEKTIGSDITHSPGQGHGEAASTTPTVILFHGKRNGSRGLGLAVWLAGWLGGTGADGAAVAVATQSHLHTKDYRKCLRYYWKFLILGVEKVAS